LCQKVGDLVNGAKKGFFEGVVFFYDNKEGKATIFHFKAYL